MEVRSGTRCNVLGRTKKVVCAGRDGGPWKRGWALTGFLPPSHSGGEPLPSLPLVTPPAKSQRTTHAFPFLLASFREDGKRGFSSSPSPSPLRNNTPLLKEGKRGKRRRTAMSEPLPRLRPTRTLPLHTFGEKNEVGGSVGPTKNTSFLLSRPPSLGTYTHTAPP